MLQLFWDVGKKISPLCVCVCVCLVIQLLPFRRKQQTQPGHTQLEQKQGGKTYVPQCMKKRKTETKIHVHIFSFCYYSVQFYVVRSSVCRFVFIQWIEENLVILGDASQNRISIHPDVPDVTVNHKSRDGLVLILLCDVVRWYIHKHTYVYMTTVIGSHIQILSSLRGTPYC